MTIQELIKVLESFNSDLDTFSNNDLELENKITELIKFLRGF